MAVPTVVDSVLTNSSSAGTTSTNTVNLPTYAAGDWLLIFHVNETRTVSTPSGWTLLKSGGAGGAAWYWFGKVAVGDEGSTRNFTMSATFWEVTAIAIAVRGADPDTFTNSPITQSAAITGTTSLACPDATAYADDTLLLRAAWNDSTVTINSPGSPANTLLEWGGSNQRARVVAENAGVSAGATGAFAFSVAGGDTWPNFRTWTVPISPSASAPPVVDTLSVTGTSQIGSTLTVNATPDQVGATPAYQWEIADDGSGTNAADLSGETASTLALTYTDFASRLDASGSGFVRVGVTYTNGNGTGAETLSAWQEVTVAAGSGGGGSPLTPPCIL